MISKNEIKELIEQGSGHSEADLVIKNVKIYNLTDGNFSLGDIAICGERIVGVGENYEGKSIIDGSGLTAVPGFIDSHIHIESTMLMPHEFEPCALAHGVTTVIWDPHEICNVCGVDILRYLLNQISTLKLDIRLALSSCVPATDVETSGKSISAADLKEFVGHPKVVGLAEMMNVPGVLSGDDSVLSKLELFYGHTDGHAPLLKGKGLNAYISAGVTNDHECSNLDEAKEKLRKGMGIFIREGSVAKNLDDLMPLINVAQCGRLAFCSDDLEPIDIATKGYIDSMVARCLAAGCEPLAVYRVASLSAAQMMGLSYKGLIAPGYFADIVLLSDFDTCKIAEVLCKGRLVETKASDKKKVAENELLCNTVRRQKVSASDFIIESETRETAVIGLQSSQLITDYIKIDMEPGIKTANVSNDIAKIAVLERHGKNGNIGLGFVQGFKMTCGAIASTVGHDSHNICVVGMNDEDMAVAVNALIEAQGGYVVVVDGKVQSLLPLPLAGLISDNDCVAVAKQQESLRRAAKLTGCQVEEPFMQLAFLPLPVIPFLKITDKGMFDVVNWKFI